MKLKDKSVKQLKKILWTWFSHYIRLRDSNYQGWAECISCGKQVKYGTKDCQAGHFISRKVEAIRFNEQNVNVQCYRCNHTLEGNQVSYQKGIDMKYGSSISKELLSCKHTTHRWTKDALLDLIEYYKEEVKVLQDIKGLK